MPMSLLALTRRQVLKLDAIQPRYLKYRSHYKIYILSFLLLSGLILSFWSLRFIQHGPQMVLEIYRYELLISGLFYLTSGLFYFGWLKNKLNRSVQVFSDHILVSNGKMKESLPFADIESLNVVCWSIFYIKMKSGIKHYFNSGLERVDYIWEGIYHSRPDLISLNDFEDYRVKLVQYDHHQKRKEWFFKHKLIDVINWAVVPVAFITLAYFVQSQNVMIHQQGLYFFRLFMFSMLVLLSMTFIFSFILKKSVFDKKIADSLESGEDKIRDIEFEGAILQRSKIFQVIASSFVLALLVKMDLNLYSVSKVKQDIASFNLKKGHTILVDNRYNCVACRYQLNDGDFVVFGRGVIGQVLAKEGDMVGQIAQDNKGRMIASENVQEVPQGHLAVKAANGKDIKFIKIEELIGKIQN
jgi:hypothetical protein